MGWAARIGTWVLLCVGCVQTGELTVVDLAEGPADAEPDPSRPEDVGPLAMTDAGSAADGSEAADIGADDAAASPADAALTPDVAVGPTCGDAVCEAGETCGDCAADCGACPPVCGDGACEGGETCGACAADCGACPPVCGDGACNGGETCGACPADCGECGWPEPLARSEEALLVMVNELRATGANCGGLQMRPVPPLRMNAQLRQAARLHSKDMADNNFFSHTGSDGSNFSVRAGRAGYGGAGGENIAAGNGSALATYEQWRDSPGHCENMMRARFSEIGVGHAEGRGQYRHYWAQVFGG